MSKFLPLELNIINFEHSKFPSHFTVHLIEIRCQKVQKYSIPLSFNPIHIGSTFLASKKLHCLKFIFHSKHSTLIQLINSIKIRVKPKVTREQFIEINTPNYSIQLVL